MPSSFVDVCRFLPTAGGTTDWTYSSAVVGYQSPTAAGAANGAIYSYRAESGDLSQWEVGFGAYNSSTGVFARTTVLFNSAGTTAKINFTAAPQVAIVALAEDLASLVSANTFNDTTEATGAGTTASAIFKGGVEILKKLFVTGAALFSGTVKSTSNGAGTASGFVSSGAGAGSVCVGDTSAGTDSKFWDFVSSGGTLFLRAINDAQSAANSFMTVARSGATIGAVSFPGAVASTSTTTGAVTVPNGGLGVVGTVNAGNVSTLGTFNTSQSVSGGAPNFDVSSQAGIAVANGGNAIIAAGAGYYTLDIFEVGATGTCASWLLALGVSTLVGSGASWVASTATPAGGNSSVHYDGTNYRVYNAVGATATYRAVLHRVG